MRARILALAVTALSGLTACSIDVYERDESRQTPLDQIVASEGSRNAAGNIAIYPGARRVAGVHTDSTNVSFTGSFADTGVVPEKFESDDAPAMVLEFYRAAMRAHADVIECRGNINIRRRRRAETAVCLERPSSQVVQLATGTRSHHRMVAVKPRGAATEFTLVSVYVR